MSMKNEEKIKNFLMENKDQEFKVSDLADKVGIDVKNMGRYLKQMEEQQQIKIRTAQEGKIRTKFISYADKPQSEIQADPAGPAATPKSEPQAPAIINDESLPPTGNDSARSRPNFESIQDLSPHTQKQTRKPSQKLNLNEILLKMEKMNPADFPAYKNTLKQLHDFKKKIFIEEMVNFLNAEIL